jgi:hypothetical protein
MTVCELCGKETFLAHKGGDVGYSVDGEGRKWIAIMCGETNEEYIARWYRLKDEIDELEGVKK